PKRLAGKIDNDHVRVTVVIEVVHPNTEAMAVNVLVTLRVIVFSFAETVRLPVRRLIPKLAVDYVQLAVLVHVADGHALGVKPLVDDDLFPFQGRRSRFGGLIRGEEWTGE